MPPPAPNETPRNSALRPAHAFDFSAIRVLDGGLATELERRGCDISGPLWSARVIDDAPEALVSVHLDYLRAGADCIATAGYQVSSLGYLDRGRPADDAAAALRRSVELAEEARSRYAAEDARPVYVAASLGPYGAALHNGAEYHGRYSIAFDDLVAFHAERLAVLAGSRADLIAFETIPSSEEAEACVRALAAFPSMRAWISFTCRDAVHVAHGEPLQACAAMLAESPQVLAIGINCTSPAHIPGLLLEVRSFPGAYKPVIVYPNSGETWDALNRGWRGKPDPRRFGELACQWYAAGAQAVGGCCRTGPAHIAAVAAALRSRSCP